MRIASIAVLAGALCLASCDDNNNDVILVSPFVGTFTLQTVNGSALPVIIVDEISPPRRVEITSGQIVIAANRTFTDVIAFRQTIGGIVSTQTVSCTGTFTSTGSSFTLVEAIAAPNCGNTFAAVLSGNSLTVTLQPGVQAVFIR